MKKFLIAATIFGALAVILGAFGAHWLDGKISEKMLQSYKTGVQYQFYHSLALLAVGLLMNHNPSKYLRWAGNLFMVGIIVFSGFIYIMAITNIRALGIVPAFGGLIWITAWIFLFIHCTTLEKK